MTLQWAIPKEKTMQSRRAPARETKDVRVQKEALKVRGMIPWPPPVTRAKVRASHKVRAMQAKVLWVQQAAAVMCGMRPLQLAIIKEKAETVTS
jgi:hypothetical protein